MLEQILLILSVTCLAMVTPGPDMVLVLGNTLASGRRAGIQTSMGILCGNLVHITYCVLGIGMLISRSILAFSAMKYVAAAYLIYLGIMSVRSGAKSLDASELQSGRLTRSWLVQGLVNNLLNPKGTLFYLGVFTAVITPETSPTATVLLILIMMLVSGSFWICFVYTLDRRTLRNVVARSQQAVNRVCGALLIFLGLRVASMSSR
jgi:RhtB (resistance to homoserine/threonine) family protein